MPGEFLPLAIPILIDFFEIKKEVAV